jgi:transcriptional regulator with XRE-family HTH domain
MGCDYDPHCIEPMLAREQEFQKQLGEHIRYQRWLNNLTQEQLGEMAGVSYKYLGEVERGTKTPSIIILFRIAQGLGITLSDLMSFSQISDQTHKIDKMVFKITNLRRK